MLNWQKFNILLLLRVMRFRFNYLFILLLLCFVRPAYAGEGLPDLRTAQNPPAMADTSQEGTAVIEADSVVGKTEDQIEASGDATVRQGGESIRADRLLFKKSSHEIDAQGAVILEQDGNTMSGPHLQFNMDTNAGAMEQPRFYLKENDARGSADALYILDRNITVWTMPPTLLVRRGIRIGR
jgi:lipopolysaccharide assembly outer membrane protein LptD (OstA)